jgi:hypothetical protein
MKPSEPENFATYPPEHYRGGGGEGHELRKRGDEELYPSQISCLSFPPEFRKKRCLREKV